MHHKHYYSRITAMSTKKQFLHSKPSRRAGLRLKMKENITTKHAEESRSMMLSWPNSALSFIAAHLASFSANHRRKNGSKRLSKATKAANSMMWPAYMVDDKPGDKQQLIDLTRDEVIELKHHLAFLRRIRPYEKP